jgi:hypothetical protein
LGKYDDSKANKDGEKLSEKKMYANPENYLLLLLDGHGDLVCLECRQFEPI